MMLPPLNLELTLSQEFKLQEITNELKNARRIDNEDLIPIIIDLTRQLMIQKNVTSSLVKAIISSDNP